MCSGIWRYVKRRVCGDIGKLSLNKTVLFTRIYLIAWWKHAHFYHIWAKKSHLAFLPKYGKIWANFHQEPNSTDLLQLIKLSN